jgi:hypothetical protein
LGPNLGRDKPSELVSVGAGVEASLIQFRAEGYHTLVKITKIKRQGSCYFRQYQIRGAAPEKVDNPIEVIRDLNSVVTLEARA